MTSSYDPDKVAEFMEAYAKIYKNSIIFTCADEEIRREKSTNMSALVVIADQLLSSIKTYRTNVPCDLQRRLDRSYQEEIADAERKAREYLERQ